MSKILADDVEWLECHDELWEMPDSIVQNTPNCAYPVDCFPGIVADAIYEVLDYYHTPVSLTATSALMNLSLAAQGIVDIKRDENLSGPVSLYGLTIADSGERKSSVDKHFSKAVTAFESCRLEEFQAIFNKYNAEYDIWNARYNGIASKLKRNVSVKPSLAKQLEKDLLAIKEEEPTKPNYPQIILEDETSESLLYKLVHGWPSAAVFSNEAGVVLGGHSMSADNIMRSLSHFNKLWDGGAVNVGRRGSESFYSSGVRLTVSLMSQEVTLRQFIEKTNGLARGSGFLSRFLIAWPESSIGTRFYCCPGDQLASRKFNKTITEILEIPLKVKINGLDNTIIELDNSARELWVNYHDMIEKELAEGGLFEDIKDTASKNAENAVRIAAILHVVENGVDGSINTRTFENAVKLAYWYLNESKRFFSEFVLTEFERSMIKMSGWLKQRCIANKSLMVSIREIQQYGPSGLRNRDKIMPILKALCKLEHIKIYASKVKVNPFLFKGI